MNFLFDFDWNLGKSDNDIKRKINECLSDISFENFVNLLESFNNGFLELFL